MTGQRTTYEVQLISAFLEGVTPAMVEQLHDTVPDWIGLMAASLLKARPAFPEPAEAEGGWALTPLDDELTLIHFGRLAGDAPVKLICVRCSQPDKPHLIFAGREADFATCLTAVLSHLRSEGHRDA